MLDHLTLRFSVSFSTKCGMFFIYRRCTPPNRLYGITDRSISVDRGLYGPIGVGCMALDCSISVDRGLYGPISIQEVFTFDF